MSMTFINKKINVHHIEWRMARIPLPLNPGNAPPDEVAQAFRLSPAFAKAIAGYSAAIYGPIHLSMREREGVRMRIAQINQCEICLNFRIPELLEQGVTEAFYKEVIHWQNSPLLSTRERLAIEYAELFLTKHLSITDDFFIELNRHFTNTEIFELTSIIAGLLTNGRLMQVLKLNQSCSLHFAPEDEIII